MKSRIILYLFSMLMAPLLFCSVMAQVQEKSETREETPREKFYRQGGKTTKAKIIVQRGQLTTADIAQGRNLNLYDDGGHSNCRAGMVIFKGEKESDFKSAYCQLTKVRDFIWAHWQNKQKGYISISFDSVDAVSTSHIFIEPDQNGKWHVAWRIVRHFGEIDDIPDIVSVERVESGSANARVGAYALVFKDKDGEEHERL